MPSFYEFFAGGGMARAGLGPNWKCLFANDFDHKKALTYQENWGTPNVLKVGDVKYITSMNLPAQADLVWGSFPCQDLSLAGGGAGLKGERSGTFYPFWDTMRTLIDDGRAPKIIALENVCGALTSHEGKDFRAICQTFADAKYRYGAVVIDAVFFVPQSRPRLFVIGIQDHLQLDQKLSCPGPLEPFHTRGLRNAFATLSPKAQRSWIWWNVPRPPRRNVTFADLIEENPASVAWHTEAETTQLLNMMSPINLAKMEIAKKASHRMVGGVYKRTRLEASGIKLQRAEIRFDGVSGCLRTPAGGSSRQVIVVVNDGQVRSRLISERETARLMGLPDDYKLPQNYNEAYHLTGDGVVVPVVRHLAQYIFEPFLGFEGMATRQAA